MIEYIKGDIVELTPTQMIIECAGIGYELNITLTTYSAFSGKPTEKIYVNEVTEQLFCYFVRHPVLVQCFIFFPAAAK